ncbi:hypothetical protein DXG01_001151 [Tephrocybe rancida]|nr:hypothetical protein DXG01_001151 [Tephrocybe rancida]
MKGYQTHLRFTRNTPCAAIYATHHDIAPEVVSETAPLADDKYADSDDENLDDIPIFEGDYFGDVPYYHKNNLLDPDNSDLESNDQNGNLDGYQSDSPDGNDNDPMLQDALNVEGVAQEVGWEPPHVASVDLLPADPAAMDDDIMDTDDCANWQPIEDNLHQAPTVIQFPGGQAGAPIPYTAQQPIGEEAYRATLGDANNLWAPFTSKIDWEIAKWAKTRGPGSTSFSELLDIDGVCNVLGLSFKNSMELNKKINTKLPGCPRFKHHEIAVGGEAFELYSRAILECIHAVWGDTNFCSKLHLSPEQHYADADCTIWLFHDMKTGKWWWKAQAEIEAREPGGTVIPIIISSDKTQLTLFGNKTAYPVYLTIGNLPKEIQHKPSKRGQILLAYLPTLHLMHISNKAA